MIFLIHSFIHAFSYSFLYIRCYSVFCTTCHLMTVIFALCAGQEPVQVAVYRQQRRDHHPRAKRRRLAHLQGVHRECGLPPRPGEFRLLTPRLFDVLECFRVELRTFQYYFVISTVNPDCETASTRGRSRTIIPCELQQYCCNPTHALYPLDHRPQFSIQHLQIT